MQKNSSQKALSTLVLCSLLAAMSIVLKELSLNLGEVLRIGFENLPIILAACAFGAPYGVLVGVLADLIGALMIYGSVIPGITLGAAAIGAVSGVAYSILKKTKLPRAITVFISVTAAHAIGSIGIKTVFLSITYGMNYPVLLLSRTLSYLIVIALEGALLSILLTNKNIEKLITRLGHKSRATADKEESTPNFPDINPLGINLKEKNAMTYSEALEYIHGVSWTFCKPGLERITKLTEAIGNPQNALKFIHIAGTNGKGSTSAMLASILQSAGYRVGLFTSPYVLSFNERMRVNGENISNATLAQITSYIRPIADSMQDKPTEFELITAIAFEYFNREGCDVVVLEAGMGGRLDSTNVITTPLLSIITNVALDHVAFLGDTVEKIAAEKAGIIKPTIPVLLGGTDEAAKGVISARAAELSSPLVTPSYSEIKNLKADLNGTEFDYKDYPRVKLNLLGLYQPSNAALVLEAVTLLRSSGLEIPDGAVYSGIAATTWSARFEILSKSPLVIFDGAHNADGISAAVSSIKTYFGERRVAVLTGVLSDKDYEFIAENVARVASFAVCITPNNPRALPAETYAALLESHGVSAQPTSSVSEALSIALERIKQTGEPLVCLGSLYTYGEVVTALKSLTE